MAKDDTTELTAYKTLRADVAARLAIPANEPATASPELRRLMAIVLRVSDHQAGLAPTTHENIPGGFDQVVHEASVLSQSEWSSIIIPGRLYELAILAALAAA